MADPNLTEPPSRTSQPNLPAEPPSRTSRARGVLFSRPALLAAFAFAVMADPVSSVAYAIEAALRALDGDLELFLPKWDWSSP